MEAIESFTTAFDASCSAPTASFAIIAVVTLPQEASEPSLFNIVFAEPIARAEGLSPESPTIILPLANPAIFAKVIALSAIVKSPFEAIVASPLIATSS